MLDKMTNQLNFHGNALVLRGERQRAIASNIANADTPGYVARDFKFGDALREATGVTSSATGTPGAAITRLATSGSYGTAGTTDPHHIPLPTVNSSTSIDRQGALGYAVQTQPSLDNNSVDLDRERANFVDNAVRYEATLRFINGNAKTMLSAIQGQ
ncbi:MAG: flagellar basal-body rod protein FlgB [Acidovorax sp. SCN 65-28]|jgi:flagellar basal-body rod protein FlgB|uniref:flagellar basal body rod protein FlgB n=1 Tax=unclassified Acidovorax TaxID=2684926 RepID=UPI00028B6F6B|nr:MULTISPECIES: flagellar basal body rod protein FlgB [unclassified Acidovorax]ODS78993.1 MAG: flagellar basal-body rod protein FlgB [Acidovorax sp. SCN 65-28]OJT97319.1 MAG: flagellar basal-body rod protein FlgB [Acidovorax sp. 65-7]AFU47875.1 flagellar basal-body rod protein FlgB [Acidovorax sp. KKS102]MBN9626619.1 flagellar basal body rod protein FlgB [Acidovorax sp.]PTT34270.1 flagellar basal body rod protein FlgB [Acidovorax sp. HMWF018]